jgi:hypothetical protein
MICQGRELPDPFDLVVKGHDEPVGYACPKCGAVFIVHNRKDEKLREADRKHQQEQAAVHCVKLCVCGQPTDGFCYLRCSACRAQMEADKEQARFEKAKKLTIEEYDGPVYWEGHSGTLGDGYFADVEDLLDHCEQEGMDPPDYVWTCDKDEMTLDAESIVEHAVEDMYDSIPAKAIVSLQAYLDTWCKEVNIAGWSNNTANVVLLREPESPAEPEEQAQAS